MVNGKGDMEALQRTVWELERQIDAVRSIAVSLSTTTRQDELIRQALNTSLSVAEADAGSILLYNPDKKKLVFEYVVGEKADELMGMEIDPEQGIAGLVFKAGGTSVSDDVSKDQAHLKDLDDKTGYVTTNMVTAPLQSQQGQPLGVIQVLNKRDGAFDEYDVNLIEIMAAQIAVALETARLHEQARLATIMRFIGNISHDVKNMVTPTMTGAETLKMIADDCFERFESDVRDIKSNNPEVDRLEVTMSELRDIYPEMVDMILEGCDAVQQRMAEISAAVKGVVSKPHFEEADVLSIVKRVAGMLNAQAQKKGVTLKVESGCDLPPAVVDGKQIYNAVYNLMFNAIDACDSGSSVTFSVQCSPEGDSMLLECADTGPGIPESVRSTLFTDEAVSTKPMGTGLGTRIVKNVIDVHGGSIEVESEVGVGTRIRCRIPMARPSDGEQSYY